MSRLWDMEPSLEILSYCQLYSMALRRERWFKEVLEYKRMCILYGSETSGEKSISQRKSYKIHFLAYLTLQGTLVKLNALREIEYNEKYMYVRWIYLTTVLNMGESRKYARGYDIVSTRTPTLNLVWSGSVFCWCCRMECAASVLLGYVVHLYTCSSTLGLHPTSAHRQQQQAVPCPPTSQSYTAKKKRLKIFCYRVYRNIDKEWVYNTINSHYNHYTNPYAYNKHKNSESAGILDL